MSPLLSDRAASPRGGEPLSPLSPFSFSFPNRMPSRFFSFRETNECTRKVIRRQPRKRGVKHEGEGTMMSRWKILPLLEAKKTFAFRRMAESRSHQTGKFHPSVVWNTSPLSPSPFQVLETPLPTSLSPGPASKRSALLRDLEEQYNKRDQARGVSRRVGRKGREFY